MKTEIEKRASKFIDETDTMQFTLMEMLVMFAEYEQCNIADVVKRSEQLKAFADYAQQRMWEDGDKDLSEFVDEFLRL